MSVILDSRLHAGLDEMALCVKMTETVQLMMVPVGGTHAHIITANLVIPT